MFDMRIAVCVHLCVLQSPLMYERAIMDAVFRLVTDNNMRASHRVCRT